LGFEDCGSCTRNGYQPRANKREAGRLCVLNPHRERGQARPTFLKGIFDNASIIFCPSHFPPIGNKKGVGTRPTPTVRVEFIGVTQLHTYFEFFFRFFLVILGGVECELFGFSIPIDDNAGTLLELASQECIREAVFDAVGDDTP